MSGESFFTVYDDVPFPPFLTMFRWRRITGLTLLAIILTGCVRTSGSDAVHTLPERVHLSVPFTPQAPRADWGPPFDEACEEAALLIAEHALRGEEFTPESAEEEIRKMIAWEEKHTYAKDVTTEELAQIARDYLGRKADVSVGGDVSAENIRRLLAAGTPVIVPAAGQMLGNPYYRGAGPPYHMLVIIGYQSGPFGPQFVTNDPGTKRGKDYVYEESVLLSAIHDWNGAKETIRHGPKVMLVLKP